MAKGKTTCRILKEIRRQIAEANDIEYVVEECQYKGDCKGTCPKCEAEVRYLENQLHKRQMLGKAVVVAGLSLGVIPTMAQEVSVVELKPNIAIQKNDAKVEGKYIIRGKLLYDNEAVIGASVFVVNSKKKNCLSDINGNFVLGLDSLPLKIEVHYVGCKYVTFDVTEENYNQFFQITLVEDPNLPEGIVEIYEPSKKVRKKQRKEK